MTDIQAKGKSLVSDEDRQRYETWGTRAAERFQAKQLVALGGGIVSEEVPGTGDEVDLAE